MNDWIEWGGGECPPPPDAHTEVRARNYVRRVGLAVVFDWQGGDIICYRILNQHLIDAARLEGIRLGLEAAVKAADAYDGLAAMSVQRLDPETIAREAVLDQLTSEGQEQNMGYDKETER